MELLHLSNNHSTITFSLPAHNFISIGMPKFLDFSSNASRSSLNLLKASSTSSKQPFFFLRTFIKQYLEDLYICSLNSAKGSVQCFFHHTTLLQRLSNSPRKLQWLLA